jgi:surface polysaccharide O-acyltransferase-like enzyme
MGPLWFIAQLLVYDLIYALWRATLGRTAMSPACACRPPGDREILLYTLALAVIDVLVRTVYPQDEWVRILGLVPAEPAHMPQYVSLFVIGIVAGRGQWFTRLPTAVGVRWFAVGVIAFLIAGLADRLPFDFWLVWGFLEAFVCVGLILGLTVLFRRHCDRPGRWLDRLDSSVYGVYLIHFFVVWVLQVAILNAPLSATAKFALVTAAALVISFSLVAALRQIPVIRRII